MSTPHPEAQSGVTLTTNKFSLRYLRIWALRPPSDGERTPILYLAMELCMAEKALAIFRFGIWVRQSSAMCSSVGDARFTMRIVVIHPKYTFLVTSYDGQLLVGEEKVCRSNADLLCIFRQHR